MDLNELHFTMRYVHGQYQYCQSIHERVMKRWLTEIKNEVTTLYKNKKVLYNDIVYTIVEMKFVGSLPCFLVEDNYNETFHMSIRCLKLLD